jgi:hypothetical protein
MCLMHSSTICMERLREKSLKNSWPFSGAEDIVRSERTNFMPGHHQPQFAVTTAVIVTFRVTVGGSEHVLRLSH